MLSRVKIQNFKSIGEPGVDLELKPLTLLVGPNGGGKSSILEGIGVAAQRSPSGQSANLPSYGDMIHKPNGSEAVIDVYFTQTVASEPRLGHRFEVAVDAQGSESRKVTGLTPALPDSVRSDVQNVIANLVSQELGPKTFLISSIRGNVQYRTGTSGDPTWVGTHGEHLLLILARIFARREHEQKANNIVAWANRFGIEGLKAGLWEGDTVGSDYLDSEMKVVLNLVLSSSGARQILTVITQLFWATKGSLLMVEEPEISLHPKAQIDVLEMFAEAIKEDKQIIATTHSHFLMQAIGYAVHKGWLVPDQIAVHHVEKGEKGTTTERLPLGENGYIEGWIPSFTQIERQLLLEWADTLPRE